MEGDGADAVGPRQPQAGTAFGGIEIGEGWAIEHDRHHMGSICLL